MHLLSPFSLNLPLYEHKKRPSYVVIIISIEKIQKVKVNREDASFVDIKVIF